MRADCFVGKGASSPLLRYRDYLGQTVSTDYRPPCPCARVNDARGLFCGEPGKGAFDPSSDIGTSRLQYANGVYNWQSASTLGR